MRDHVTAALEALAASVAAWRAFSELILTAWVRLSMLDAVDAKLLEVCSVRWAKSLLPEAISLLAVAMLSVLWRTCATMVPKERFMVASERIKSPNSSARDSSTCPLRSPSAMRVASALACSKGCLMERMRKAAPIRTPMITTIKLSVEAKIMRRPSASKRSRSARLVVSCRVTKV